MLSSVRNIYLKKTYLNREVILAFLTLVSPTADKNLNSRLNANDFEIILFCNII